MVDIYYSVTLFNPTQDEFDMSVIPESFTSEYFVDNLLQQWPQSKVRNLPSEKYLNVFIPELDSGDPDNDFVVSFYFREKAIVFRLALYETIVEFVRWIISILPRGIPAYFLRISDINFAGLLHIIPETQEEDIMAFLESAGNSL